MFKKRSFSKFVILRSPDELTVYCDKRKINVTDTKSNYPESWTVFRKGAEDDFDYLANLFKEVVEKNSTPKWGRVNFSKWMRPNTVKLPSYHIWVDNYTAFYLDEEVPQSILDLVGELREGLSNFIEKNASRFRKNENHEE